MLDAKKIQALLRIVLLNLLGLSVSGLQLNLQVEDDACLKLWASLQGLPSHVINLLNTDVMIMIGLCLMMNSQ